MQGSVGLIPDQGVKIPQGSGQKKQNIKQKRYCNKLNEDFKNSPRLKKKKKLKKKFELYLESHRIQ